MLLEVILAVLGVLIIAVGIWNIFVAGSIVWGIVFLIGGIWALWLGISYILQIQKIKKKSNTQGNVKTKKSPKPETEDKKKDVTSEEQPDNREESDMFFSRKETRQKESNLADFGELSIENAVIMDEEVDDVPLVDDDPVEAEIVSDRMIFEEFIEESIYASTTTVSAEDIPEEISSETIEEDPEPIRFAEAEFIDDTDTQSK